MLKISFLIILFLSFSSYSFASDFQELIIYDSDEHELVVDVYPAKGKYLQIFLTRHSDNRLMFEKLIADTVKSGIEVWRINLVTNYFLPESSDSIDKLSGHGVSALIKHAIELTNKNVFVSAYDRMSLVALKGIYHWQSSTNYTLDNSKHFLGSVLFYPNFYNEQKMAGLAPDLADIVKISNLPVVIFQPKFGGHINNIEEILSTFWSSDTAAFSYIVPGVQD